MTVVKPGFDIRHKVMAREFTRAIRRAGFATMARIAFGTGVVLVVGWLFQTFVPGVFPSLENKGLSIGQPSNQPFDKFETYQAWSVLFFFIAWVSVVIWAIYRFTRFVRHETIARFCRAAGLLYLRTSLKHSFETKLFSDVGLVGEHEMTVPLDLIAWADRRHHCIVAEVGLLAKKRFLLDHVYKPVFGGTLLYVDGPDYSDLTESAKGLAIGFRSYGERWLSYFVPPVPSPGLTTLLSRVGELADTLSATEVEGRLYGDHLLFALKHPRDSFPVPPFWTRARDTEVFEQIGADLHALAELAHVVDPGRRMSGPIDRLPDMIAAKEKPEPESNRKWLVAAAAVVLVQALIVYLVIR